MQAICSQCKKEFDVEPDEYLARMGRNKGGRIFCSRNCFQDSRKLLPKMFECGFCKKAFMIMGRFLKNREGGSKCGLCFCSHHCASCYRTRQWKQRLMREAWARNASIITS